VTLRLAALAILLSACDHALPPDTQPNDHAAELTATPLTEERCRGLDVALNEALVLGFEVDPERRYAAATFLVLTLPEEGPAPEDRRVQLLFRPVGRVSAGYWQRENPDAPWQLIPFGIDQLLDVVQALDHPAVEGWSTFDIDDSSLRAEDRGPSLDWESGPDGREHSITIGPIGRDQALDLTVWFDALEVRTPTGEVIPLDEFIAGGKRWWDGLHSGDERTRGYGILPGKPSGPDGLSCQGCGATVTIEPEALSVRCASCGAVFHR